MRILIGYTNHIPQIRDGLPLPTREGSGDEILAFGGTYEQVRHEPGMAWEDLLANCPPGWRPDVYIHWSPEYNALPQGLERADCLTVGVFGDWNLGGHAIRSVAGSFDVLVADGAGSELLRQAGNDNVLTARLWAYDPDLHRRLPSSERDIDILMIGNLNHAIHVRRSRFVARVARLSTRHNVVLNCGIHGEEYTRMMNRAKIVFNHSVGGGINMRAYEAPACGALLFNEADSNEIRALYTNGVDCVLYAEDNLEALLDHYLAPEHAAEREAMAQAGWERVQPHTYARHFADLLTRLEPLATAYRQEPDAVRTKRAFHRLSQYQRTLSLAAHWVRTNEPGIYNRLEALLQAAEQGGTNQERAELACQYAVLLGKWAVLSPSPAREHTFSDAIAQARRAVQLEPDYIMGHCNLAYLCLTVKDFSAGERILLRVQRMLNAPKLRPEQLRGDHFPHTNYFHMESEHIWGRCMPGSSEWRDAIRDALRCRIGMTLAEMAQGRADFALAALQSRDAITAAPAVAKAHYDLGLACRALGRLEAAAAAFRHTIDLSPFLLEAWQNLGQVYLEMDRPAEALALMDDLAAILDGCPFYAPIRREYDRLREQACDRVKGFAHNIPTPV